MNQLQIIAILVFILIVAVFIIFKNTMFVKKYWRYALILLPAALLIVLKILSTKKKDDTKPDDLSTYVGEVKDQLQEAKLKTAVEVTAAREDNKEKLEQLKEVCKITDSQERRKRLAEMMG